MKAHSAIIAIKRGNWRRISTAHAQAAQVKLTLSPTKADDRVA
jgi:hypothetical protein